MVDNLIIATSVAENVKIYSLSDIDVDIINLSGENLTLEDGATIPSNDFKLECDIVEKTISNVNYKLVKTMYKPTPLAICILKQLDKTGALLVVNDAITLDTYKRYSNNLVMLVSNDGGATYVNNKFTR